MILFDRIITSAFSLSAANFGIDMKTTRSLLLVDRKKSHVRLTWEISLTVMHVIIMRVLFCVKVSRYLFYNIIF